MGRGLESEQDKDKNWWDPASEQGGDTIWGGRASEQAMAIQMAGPVLEQGQDRAYLCECWSRL